MSIINDIITIQKVLKMAISSRTYELVNLTSSSLRSNVQYLPGKCSKSTAIRHQYVLT